jgi:hypothetical protein
MGNCLGNLIGLLLLCVAVVVAFFSLEAATIVFACIAYFVFACLWVFERIGRPPREVQIAMMLRQGMLPTDENVAAYRKHHIFVNTPAVGQLMSALLNNLRLVGIVWAILAMWNGYWWSAVANAGCFFVFGATCARLDPSAYLRTAAQAGHPSARRQLPIIASLVAAREAWLSRPHRDKDVATTNSAAPEVPAP